VTAPAPRPWRALLDGRLADRALRIAGELAAALVARVDEAAAPHPAVAATAALVMHHVARSTATDEPAAAAQRMVERAVDGLADHVVTSALHGGLSGVGFVLAHVRDLASDDPDDPVDAIDAALLEALDAHASWRGDVDLISGLVGIGVHAVQRRHRPGGPAMVERIVAHLERAARPTDRGIAIWRPPEQLSPRSLAAFPDGCFDLGMAHGSAGVVAWLADVHRAGLGSRASARLLDGSVAWLLAHAAEEGWPYPAQVGAGGARLPGRAAWCYGDPGIAVALYKAGAARGNPTWQQRGLALAHRATALAPDRTGVVNAFLCHGHLGQAHLYNRLGQAAQSRELTRIAQAAYARALDLGERHGFAAPWHDTASPEPVVEGTPIAGTAGVALALLAGATAIEPRWDDLLLLGAMGSAPEHAGPRR
jgi:hypothetical protein